VQVFTLTVVPNQIILTQVSGCLYVRGESRTHKALALRPTRYVMLFPDVNKDTFSMRCYSHQVSLKEWR
jgi:hypothetical protein